MSYPRVTIVVAKFTGQQTGMHVPTITITDKRLIIVSQGDICPDHWAAIVHENGLSNRFLFLNDYRMDDSGTETWAFSFAPVDTKVQVV